MVGDDQLVGVILFVDEGVVCFYDGIGSVYGEGVEVVVDGDVIIDFDLMQVDFVRWFVLEEVDEIIFFFCWCQVWCVGDGWQQDGLFCIIGYDLFGIICLKVVILVVK